MSDIQYIGIIHKDHDCEFGVSFPDFPGCITAGHDLEDLHHMAEEALSGHIECMIEAGYNIPEPSSFETIMRDPDFSDGMAIPVKVKVQQSA
jgi:predicted RNase H-like HicB family nuclease